MKIPTLVCGNGCRTPASLFCAEAANSNRTKLLATATMIALSACSTPAVQTKIQIEKVPVAITPIKPADVPVPPAPLPKRPDSLSDAADLLLSQVCTLEAYVLRADPLLRLSAGEQPQALPKYPECEGN